MMKEILFRIIENMMYHKNQETEQILVNKDCAQETS